jgi:hypothetical protein
MATLGGGIWQGVLGPRGLKIMKRGELELKEKIIEAKKRVRSGG